MTLPIVFRLCLLVVSGAHSDTDRPPGDGFYTGETFSKVDLQKPWIKPGTSHSRVKCSTAELLLPQRFLPCGRYVHDGLAFLNHPRLSLGWELAYTDFMEE